MSTRLGTLAAVHAKIMPIMLYAPAMLLCQFLCWHNPLDPNAARLCAVENVNSAVESVVHSHS